MPPPDVTRAYFSRLNHEDVGRRFRERLLEQVGRGETVREITADKAVQ